jgi:hypothetical protein
MGKTRLTGIAVAAALAAGAAAFTISAGTAHAGGSGAGGVSPQAVGTQQVSSGPGVYDQTTSQYAGSWAWSQLSASYDYYWYIFQSNGTLALSGHKALGGGDNKTLTPNIYYFKEYNNEPLGSARINTLSVDYCC